MRLNADFSQRVALQTRELPWQPSPDGSVERRMLDRIGEEVARATSIVRYPPGSRFRAHEHGLGEEFLVLDGIFSDEHGDYPRGTYVRNPPGSRHTPGSEAGCILFVKLRQFQEDDDRQVVERPGRAWQPSDAAGLRWLPLHTHGPEQVRLVQLDAGFAGAERIWPAGAEFLVLDGACADAGGEYRAGTWLRLPPGSRQRLVSTTGGTLYLKSGHLPVAGQR
jgi:anti-sigma factor ChrR (cupin superfamily)